MPVPDVKQVDLFWDSVEQCWSDTQPRTRHEIGKKIRGGKILYRIILVPEYMTREDLIKAFRAYIPPADNFYLTFGWESQWGTLRSAAGSAQAEPQRQVRRGRRESEPVETVAEPPRVSTSLVLEKPKVSGNLMYSSAAELSEKLSTWETMELNRYAPNEKQMKVLKGYLREHFHITSFAKLKDSEAASFTLTRECTNGISRWKAQRIMVIDRAGKTEMKRNTQQQYDC